MTPVALLLAACASPSLAAPQPAIAVFNDPHFPFFGTACGLTPPDVASYLHEIGLAAELLGPQQLADPQVLTAGRFCALVHLYGNTFPVDAAENLRRFHQQGGGLISTGVPYCHPCRQVGAAGWTYVAADSDSVERVNEGAREGRFCLRLRKDSTPNWTGACSTRLPTAPGTTYRVSGWVRTEGGPGSKDYDILYLRFFGKDGEFLGQWGPRLPQDAPDWQLVSHDVQAPERAERMDVCLGFWGSPGTVWLDDVSVAMVTGPFSHPLEALPNPGFEEPGGEWLDLGHQQEWMRHDRIGSGEFHSTTGDRGPLTYHADADALHLGLLDWARWAAAWDGHFVISQSLDPRSLPPEDEAVSILDYHDGDQTYPVIALICHGCAEFKGAVDAWVGGQLFAQIGYYDPVDQRELIARAAIAAAAESGRLPAKRREALLRRADTLYRRDRPPSHIAVVAERKPFDGLFPKSPAPARELVVADLRHASLEEQVLLTSLQGLVNRTQPRLYFILNSFPDAPSPDERWLTWLQERGDVDSVRRVEDPLSLLGEFREAYRGVVVTDPFVPATTNVATMVAATEDLLVATPHVARVLKLPVRRNLQGHWRTNAQALQWAVDALWPKLNHHLLAYNAPDWPYLIDYLVAHKAFSLWISGPVDGEPPAGAPLAEQLVIEHLLAKAPPNVGCLGAPYNGVGVGIGEGPGVSLLTRYGKFLSWSAQNANLSVHSAALLPSPERRGDGGEAPLDPTKVHVTLLISDGDAPVNWYSFFAARYWDDPLRGTFPLTWSVGPSVYDLLPDLVDYYTSRANETDCFVAACSGAGYCYPDAFASQYADSDAIFDSYLKLTDQAMRRLDLHGVWTHTASGARLAGFAERVPSVAFMLPDYGRLPTTTAGNANAVLAGHVPIFRALTTFNPDLGDQATMKLMLDDIRRYTPAERPAFMHVFVQCYPWTPTKLRRMLGELGPEYVPVRADQLAELYLDSQR